MLTTIEDWLTAVGLQKYVEVFVENEIDSSVLSELTEDDLKELGLPMGPRKKIIAAVREGSLSEASADDHHTSATEKGLSAEPEQASSNEAERRHMTVMFCDVVGSTDYATSLCLAPCVWASDLRFL